MRVLSFSVEADIMAEKLYLNSRIHRPTVARLAELASNRGLDATTDELSVYKSKNLFQRKTKRPGTFFP